MSLLHSVLVVTLNARPMALDSALQIEVLLRSRFVILELCWMAEHDTLFPFMEPSV